MTTIEFTIIPDSDADYSQQLELMANFKRETGVEVKLTRWTWGNAWQQMIDISTHGQGPDISQVGSTWVSSLVSMNALRPIPSQIIARIGGEDAFVHSAWESVVMGDDKNPWSIPLTSYTYAVAYRRDLLAQLGLDGDAAFATPSTFEDTIRRLEQLNAVKDAWLMPFVPFPFSDFVHNAASWIWSSGGQMLDNRGKQVLFDSPATLAGLKAYFRLMRRLPTNELIYAPDCMQHLVRGNAAAVLTDSPALFAGIQQGTPETEKLAAASLLSLPWSGSGNVVIWRHTYGYPDRLEAVFKLAEFLTSKNTMIEVGRRSHKLPARMDALDELIPVGHPLRSVKTQLVSSSRTYRTIPLWRRIENQFGQELATIAGKTVEHKETDVDALLTESMKFLTQRLNLTLE